MSAAEMLSGIFKGRLNSKNGGNSNPHIFIITLWLDVIIEHFMITVYVCNCLLVVSMAHTYYRYYCGLKHNHTDRVSSCCN